MAGVITVLPPSPPTRLHAVHKETLPSLINISEGAGGQYWTGFFCNENHTHAQLFYWNTNSQAVSLSPKRCCAYDDVLIWRVPNAGCNNRPLLYPCLLVVSVRMKHLETGLTGSVVVHRC